MELLGGFGALKIWGQPRVPAVASDKGLGWD